MHIWEPELQRLGVENQTLLFQQDGATAHTVRTAMRVLNEMFPARLLSRRGILKIAGSQRLRFLTLGIAQEQGVQKETKDNGGFET